jgi:hypothetical protein
MKMHPMGAELFHADRWRDRHDDTNSRFLQFCEHAYKGIHSWNHVSHNLKVTSFSALKKLH